MVQFSDYFNSTTLRGRANVAKATYASIAAIYVYSRFKKSKNKTEQHTKHDHKLEEHNHGKNGHGAEAHAADGCPRCNECNKTSNGHNEAAANGAAGHHDSGESHGHGDSTKSGHGEPSSKSHDNGAAKSAHGSHDGH